MKARCFECGKKVNQLTSRYAKDKGARLNYEKGTLTGERVYGPDCFTKLVGTGAIRITDDGAVATDAE